MSFYAVRVGRAPGIYADWTECKHQIEGFSGAQYKKFNSREGAVAFISASRPSSAPEPLPPVSSRVASPKASPRKKNIIYIDSDDERPTKVSVNEKATAPSRSVMELIEEKRQQAKQRRKEKRLEAEVDALTTASTTSALTSSTSFPSQGPVLLKRRNSSLEASPRPQKRANATSASALNDNNIKRNNDKVIIFTDGACSSNGQMGAVAGIGVYFGDSDPRNLSEALEGDRQTNQRAELTAAIRGLEAVSLHHTYNVHVELQTDSIYVVKGITEWIHRWKKLQWNTSAKSPVVNKDLWERLDQLNTSFRKVDWVHILGHTGIKGNEEADKLAVNAVSNAKK